MKKTTKFYLWYGGLALFVVLLFTILGYYFFHPLTRQEIPIDVTIGDYVGINLDPGSLHFGTLLPGTSARRYFVLRADQEDIAISLIVADIPFVIPEATSFILHKGENRSVTFTAAPPKELEKRTYIGKLIILTKRL